MLGGGGPFKASVLSLGQDGTKNTLVSFRSHSCLLQIIHRFLCVQKVLLICVFFMNYSYIYIYIRNMNDIVVCR